MIKTTNTMNPTATIRPRILSLLLDEVVVGTFMDEGLEGASFKDKRFPHS